MPSLSATPPHHPPSDCPRLRFGHPLIMHALQVQVLYGTVHYIAFQLGTLHRYLLKSNIVKCKSKLLSLDDAEPRVRVSVDLYNTITTHLWSDQAWHVRVNEVSCNFTCHPQVEWAIPAFTTQLQSVTALWLVLIFSPTEGRRLSWPEWVVVKYCCGLSVEDCEPLRY